MALIGFVAYSSIGPKDGATNVSVVSVGKVEAKPTVDQLVEATVVADVAQVVNLPIATNAANTSVTLGVKYETMQTSESVITKPVIIDVSGLQRGIVVHKVLAGESLAVIAEHYGVSTQTLRWANGLKDESISSGADLLVPAVDGVVYTVSDGDTIEALVEKYQSPAEKITVFNDLELSGLVAGAKIILPDGILPEKERPDYVAPVVIPVYVGPQNSNPMVGVSAGNRYAYGYCTWYAYERRVQLGRPVGSYWGNANTWYSSAIVAGFAVGNEPAPGAVMQSSGAAAGFANSWYGHVAVVESVDYEAGVVIFSEMNGQAGWNRVGYRTFTLDQARQLNYIY